jgi:hypothetical protein
MSGMYGLVFPDPKRPERVSLLLGFVHAHAPVDVGRLRDAWLEPDRDGEPVVCTYTRNGGGNRTCEHLEVAPQAHCPACAMQSVVNHPLYIRDEDDGFDCTYARIWFKLPPWLPEEIRAALKTKLMLPVAVDTDERWQRGIEAVGKGPLTPEQREFGDRLVASLSDMMDPPTRES